MNVEKARKALGLKDGLPNDVIDEMQYILDRIEDGTFKHDQENWHCGTAHCFFGWKQMLDLQKVEGFKCPERIKVESGDDERLGILFQVRNVSRGAVRNYVQRAWGLMAKEASYLANGMRRFEELQVAVTLLREQRFGTYRGFEQAVLERLRRNQSTWHSFGR